MALTKNINFKGITIPNAYIRVNSFSGNKTHIAFNVGIPLVAGAVEILRFPFGSYFSGLAAGATTVYVTPGEGI